MTTVSLNLDQIFSSVARRAQAEDLSYSWVADTATISYSWFGSPSVSINLEGQAYSTTLSTLETIAIEQIRTMNQTQSPEEFVKRAYLIDTVRQLQMKSQDEIANANIISLIFFRIRSLLTQLFQKCGIIPNDAIAEFHGSNISMPLAFAQQNRFMTRFPPTGPQSGDTVTYTHEQLLAILPQLMTSGSTANAEPRRSNTFHRLLDLLRRDTD